MSLLSWFRKKPDASASMLPSSGLSRLESTRPFGAGGRGAHGSAQPANRKQERLERRELLYGVVREAMMRAGVLTSGYKFKVLSLDARGRQFLVMVDLAQATGAETARLAEIEAMIAQTAKSRHDILVTAVYWRANEHVASGDPAHPMSSRPVPLMEVPHVPPQRPPTAHRRVEPLQQDEVAAFKKALAAGVRGEQALASANVGKTPQSYTLLTGFEDTEMAEGTAGHLGATQYGALR